MNNIIVIAFTGNTPTKKELRALAEAIKGEVEVINLIDSNSIASIVGKSMVSEISFDEEDKPLKEAAIFLNAHFNSPWDLLSAIGNARNSVINSAEETALLNAVDIVANNTAEECEKYGIPAIIHNTCYNMVIFGC